MTRFSFRARHYQDGACEIEWDGSEFLIKFSGSDPYRCTRRRLVRLLKKGVFCLDDPGFEAIISSDLFGENAL